MYINIYLNKLSNKYLWNWKIQKLSKITIHYIKNQYGENSVTQIITFGKMKAKQVVRDVGRVMGYSFGDVDRVAKAIPNELNITLNKALTKSTDLQTMANGEYKELIDFSKVFFPTPS